jgi:hypothetical protein
MGFLTPILFRNDSADILEQEPEQVVQAIISAMNNTRERNKSFSIRSTSKRKWYQLWKPKRSFAGTVHANPIEALKTRHAETTSLFLFRGNTWTDLTEYIYNRDETDLEYIETSVKIAQKHLNELKKIVKLKKEKIED